MPLTERILRAGMALLFVELVAMLLILAVAPRVHAQGATETPVCSQDWSKVEQDVATRPDLAVRYVLQPSLVKTIEDNFNKMTPPTDFHEPVLAFVIDKHADQAYLFFLNKDRTCVEHYTGAIPGFQNEVKRLMTPNAPAYVDPAERSRGAL